MIGLSFNLFFFHPVCLLLWCYISAGWARLDSPAAGSPRAREVAGTIDCGAGQGHLSWPAGWGPAKELFHAEALSCLLLLCWCRLQVLTHLWNAVPESQPVWTFDGFAAADKQQACQQTLSSHMLRILMRKNCAESSVKRAISLDCRGCGH